MSSDQRLAKVYRRTGCSYASCLLNNIPKDRSKMCRRGTPSDKIQSEPVVSSHSVNVFGTAQFIPNGERDIFAALSSILEYDNFKTLEYDLKANKTPKRAALLKTTNEVLSLKTVNKGFSPLNNGTQLHTYDFNDGFSSALKSNSINLNKNSDCCIENNFNLKSDKLTHKWFPWKNIWSTFLILSKKQLLSVLIIAFMLFLRVTNCQSLLIAGPKYSGLSDDLTYGSGDISISNSSYKKARIGSNAEIVDGQLSSAKNILGADGSTSGLSSSSTGPYLDILDNLERSVAAVIIKVAYGTTSTTKRSIPDNINLPSLTTIATPPLTTLRYLERMPHQQQINLHHRNYELDLERDHALPTSAPNADILKSNSNPTYPNPNRHQSHDRERHRHILNSSPVPSTVSSIWKKKNSSPTAGIPILPGDMPSYSPPARAFFTPPLPPEYQNPFADKPTLRGTNNEAVSANTANYINRRPLPPPSLMPGHERIPLRPPELANSGGLVEAQLGNDAAVSGTYSSSVSGLSSISSLHGQINVSSMDWELKKVLNTPSKSNGGNQVVAYPQTTTQIGHIGGISTEDQPTTSTHTRKEVLPSIRRILSGSNGNKGEVPEVLLKRVTSRPIFNYNQPPSSPVVVTETTSQENSEDSGGLVATSNINRSKANNKDNNAGTNEDQKNLSKVKISTKAIDISQDGSNEVIVGFTTTPSVAPAIGEVAAATSTSTTTATNTKTVSSPNSSTSSTSSSSSRSAAEAEHATWTVAWNIHVYLSVILFTILGVYSLYKILTYNKLTHLFSQSYFICIHLILVIICSSRIFYLCYDAYNIHSTFHVFVSEILLNLPATFLTISFSVLILFLFLKSLNHKNNRYSALIRPLTVVVGCGVHVVLCITLHYVESYTMQNHQQHLYYQQQFYRRQAQQHTTTSIANINAPITATLQHTTSVLPPPPPRVLSLICQIIYIFICLSLGLLYLYIYRILKRILHSKSKNYMHGFQNLSYAIHITIATAWLFVLLAALQIFGAISISITRPLITQTSVEMDWLQWGYQFSLRLIEIAIITLMSWVAGLKASGGMDTIVGDGRAGVGSGSDTGIFGPSDSAGTREKHSHHHHATHHTNVAGFFLPCTSSSSQEHFETDYPAVCNANTNLHTYTMRTGKLIYDDSFALNSLGSAGQSMPPNGGGVRKAEFHMQSTYQRPYDTGSIHSSTNHNVEFMSQGSNYHHHSQHTYGDYLINATTDHYENPNFELRSGKTSTTGNTMQNLAAQTSTTSTTASCSGGSASGTSSVSQQQMLLMKSDTCYSEPMQQNFIGTSNYAFNNFERPNFVENNGLGSRQPMSTEAWPDQHSQNLRNREKKSCTHFERATYENPERRSSNSTHSCSSGGGGFERFFDYNFELNHNGSGMRKSGTLNNIVDDGIVKGRNPSSGTSPIVLTGQRSSRSQTLASAHLQQQQIKQINQRSGRNNFRVIGSVNHGKEQSEQDFSMGHASLERTNSHSIHVKQLQKHQHCLQHNSDDDMILAGGNAECTNLISNGDDTCAYNSTAPDNPASEIGISGNDRPINKSLHFISPNINNKQQQQLGNHVQKSAPAGFGSLGLVSESTVTSAESGTSDSMLGDHAFVRFQIAEDINNTQSIQNTSERHQKGQFPN